MSKSRVRMFMIAVAVQIATSTFAHAQTWTQRFPSMSPPLRFGHGLAYDSARGEVVLFGGRDASLTGGQYNDTWVWNGTTWKEKFPANSPSARSHFAMVYDAARSEVLLFGGSVGGEIVDETWVWDGLTWTQRFPAISPPPRWNARFMAYDAARQQVVMFDGTAQLLADTWVWDGTGWTKQFPATSPPPHDNHAMTYDGARQRVVLVGGGVGFSNIFLNDTWEWDGVTWTRQTPSNSPSGRWNSDMAYDPARGEVVLFGGSGTPDQSGALGDTWIWDGVNWILESPNTSPSGRFVHAMAFDAARGQILLFGGVTTSTVSDETWVWGVAPIETLCPCAGPIGGGSWKNHGQYVSCVASAAKSWPDADVIVSSAAKSSCGK